MMFRAMFSWTCCAIAAWQAAQALGAPGPIALLVAAAMFTIMAMPEWRG